jgi:hypothetical protein
VTESQNRGRMSHRVQALLLGLFLLGFPAGGLLWFWADAHNRIERNAVPAAQAMAQEFLRGWDATVLEEAGTNELRQEVGSDRVAAWRERFGSLESLSPFRAEKSWAGARDDMVWQFVKTSAPVEFEKGRARVTMTVGRRTMSPEWRIESLAIDPE